MDNLNLSEERSIVAMYPVTKTYLGLLLDQHKTHFDFSTAWFDCTKEMMRICREGRDNGEDALQIWESCQHCSYSMIDAFSSYVQGQSQAMNQFCGMPSI